MLSSSWRPQVATPRAAPPDPEQLGAARARLPEVGLRGDDVARPFGLGPLGAVERIQALPGLSDENRRDVPVGSEAVSRLLAALRGGALGAWLCERQPEGAADLLVQALLEGADGAVVVDAENYRADQIAKTWVDTPARHAPLPC